ncbi:nuclease-related domain-containing protein [Bacillus niameyensis]|uniref:nuclease-related domain-containing protein n=1 Tax=Bacillus niameyensis TaxID=1522308 RepID=UPI0007860687|nr:nuclease-related domain-containing protein [Bacillus niameyensis]
MFIKRLTKPIELEATEALFRRVHPDHPSKPMLQIDLRKRISGYQGEKSIEYPLKFLKNRYRIFQSLRLPNDVDSRFQIDATLASQYLIFLISVKNIRSELEINHGTGQMIQKADGQEFVYDDPDIQIQHHLFQFRDWLRRNRFPSTPIVPLIVFTDPTTILRFNGNADHFRHYILKSQLHLKIFELEKAYTKIALSQQDIRRLTVELLKQHSDPHYPILELYKIRPEDILTGVHCPNCGFLPMKRIFGKWLCVKCQSTSRMAHASALKDYALLLGNTITNAQCRRFLHVNTPTQTTNILSTMNLKYIGKTKGRVYYLDSLK